MTSLICSEIYWPLGAELEPFYWKSYYCIAHTNLGKYLAGREHKDAHWSLPFASFDPLQQLSESFQVKGNDEGAQL